MNDERILVVGSQFDQSRLLRNLRFLTLNDQSMFDDFRNRLRMDDIPGVLREPQQDISALLEFVDQKCLTKNKDAHRRLEALMHINRQVCDQRVFEREMDRTGGWLFKYSQKPNDWRAIIKPLLVKCQKKGGLR